MTAKTGRVALVLGTRPEVVKLDGIRRLLGEACSVIHTGQHFDETMSASFYRRMGWPDPDLQLDVGGQSRGVQIGRATAHLDGAFRDLMPSVVVVQGDTNAVLAGALAANSRTIPLVHVEAGLRSHDRRMPEEHNRVLVDHLADLCLAPTEQAAWNLESEGIPDDRVRITGNTVVEGVQRFLPNRAKRRELLERLGLARRNYVLATIHRPENTDDAEAMEQIVDGLGGLGMPVIWPLHPRLEKVVASLEVPDIIKLVAPMDYGDFLTLQAESAFIVTDSGGIQEEVTVLKIPTIVVRRSTERPEAMDSFAWLATPAELRTRLDWLVDVASDLRDELQSMPSPFGDGQASHRSVDHIFALLDSRKNQLT